MKAKSFTITYQPRTKESIPAFTFEGTNMEKYEAIGLMYLAIENIKNECIKENKNVT